jgi:hypothetical protein
MAKKPKRLSRVQREIKSSEKFDQDLARLEAEIIASCKVHSKKKTV